MLKTYKYRLLPTPEQKVSFSKHFGACRWFYNFALSNKKSAFELDGTIISISDLSAILPVLKISDETSWLSEINAQSLQAVLGNLNLAYQNFFTNKNFGHPKFKTLSGHQSFVCKQRTKIDVLGSTLSVRVIKNIPIVLHRKFEGRIVNVTIKKTPTNKYFACILVDTPHDAPKKSKITTKKTIGIDLGIKDFAVLDNGEKIPNPTYLKKSMDRLRILQSRGSKKMKGSANKRKSNLRVAKLHEKIVNKRTDFMQKLSYRLVRENQATTFCMEDLGVKNMLKNRTLSRAISDVCWPRFVSMMKYKCDWYGKNLIQIGRFEPSSKTCSVCGNKNDKLKLSERKWKCVNCNHIHDRDVNAAINIKKIGFKKLSGEALSVESVEQRTQVLAMKQKQCAHDAERL